LKTFNRCARVAIQESRTSYYSGPQNSNLLSLWR
jgi:hypothetical protein